MNHPTRNTDPASFRDPSGFMFSMEGEHFRAIAPGYFENFALLHNSKLYDTLVEKRMLIPHSPVNSTGMLPAEFSEYKVIQPEKIPFISYPYEWCFSQLKRAALLTLSIQQEALRHGMSLKDASAFNVQFIGSEPIFIDTLSFEKYGEGKPWVAYGQFCRHFLAPLALIAYKNDSLAKLSQVFLDGIPLELASSLLTKRSYLNSGIAAHIHAHSKFRANTAKKNNDEKKITLTKKQLLNIIDHLTDTVSNLNLKPQKSLWNKYASENSYTEGSKKEKSKIISGWLESTKPKTIWDMGCNTGTYSLPASVHCESLIAMDADYQSIELLYRSTENSKTKKILPLVIDLANPTPAIGWENRERKTLIQRGKPDLIMALALVHHLRITGNIPFKMIAGSFSDKAEWLIVEYVPKEDVQVKEMLSQRADTFEDFSTDKFKKAFEEHFNIQETYALPDSERVLFLMKRKRS